MLDWLLAILHKPFSELTLLDVLKVAGAFMGAGLATVFFISFLRSDRKK